MRRSRLLHAALLGVVATATALASSPAALAATASAPSSHVRVCGAPAKGAAQCDAIRNDAAPGAGRAATVNPSGYHPNDLVSAYKLSGTGSGQTVAIVDAYDDPNAEADLATYRTQFGLAACTTANRCFRKVDQKGTTKYPTANGSWAQEISLDLDMVSAVCPGCRILLVEASTSSLANLGTAVNTAARLGATEISNSYGGAESASDQTYDSTYFTHAGIPITASSGDGGYGVEYPAASPEVTAVGGTSLKTASNTRGWVETAWSSAGSGCSTSENRPSWQGIAAITAICPNGRAVADVSAVADPSTGVSVYDSYRYQGVSGWLVFGGTSVAAPVIAGVYALAGGKVGTAAGLYAAPSTDFSDVMGGSNGTCGGGALCTATSGWDGPTGLGSPNGTAAF
jgi:subtilase family serine protease